MSDTLREALFDELDKPGTITKARLRNILIDMPVTNPDESARELLAQGWDEGYRQGKSDHCDNSPSAEYCNIENTNPYRQPINFPGAAK